MINKKKMWFLTLSSLVLVLSLYYITMPESINTQNVASIKDNPVDNITESSILVALRVENEEETLNEMATLKEILTDVNKTVEEKNEAFNKIKELNLNKGEEEQLEKILKEEFKSDFFIKVKGDKIKVVTNSTDKSIENVNKIMVKVQENYTSKVYITVEFK